jgi:hypothetical protein
VQQRTRTRTSCSRGVRLPSELIARSPGSKRTRGARSERTATTDVLIRAHFSPACGATSCLSQPGHFGPRKHAVFAPAAPAYSTRSPHHQAGHKSVTYYRVAWMAHALRQRATRTAATWTAVHRLARTAAQEHTASLRAPLKRNRQSTQQEREGITATGAATQERIFFCLRPAALLPLLPGAAISY